MMRKTALALIIAIGALMFYTGCDGGGDGGGGDGTPVPTGQPRVCGSSGADCPCDFFSVPMTDGCWPEPEFRPEEAHGVSLCSLVPFSAFFGFAMAILPQTQCITLEGSGCCLIEELASNNCAAPDILEGLRFDQVEECRICLEEYATELNDAGITVTGGPPYICVGP